MLAGSVKTVATLQNSGDVSIIANSMLTWKYT